MLITIQSTADAFEAMRAIQVWLNDDNACPWPNDRDLQWDRGDVQDALDEAWRVMRRCHAASRKQAQQGGMIMSGTRHQEREQIRNANFGLPQGSVMSPEQRVKNMQTARRSMERRKGDGK